MRLLQNELLLQRPLKGFIKSTSGAMKLRYVSSYGWKFVYFPARVITKQERQNMASRRNFFLWDPSGRAPEKAKHMDLSKRPPNVLQNTLRSFF